MKSLSAHRFAGIACRTLRSILFAFLWLAAASMYAHADTPPRVPPQTDAPNPQITIISSADTAKPTDGDPPSDSNDKDGPMQKPPYIFWKHHEGVGKECVTLIRLESGPAVSALVVRCDGFMIAPGRVAATLDEHRQATVAITQADGGEPDGTEKLTDSIPVAGRVHASVSPNRADYSVVKINDHHIRCSRLLAARNIRTGMPVEIVYAIADPSLPSHCRAVSMTGTVGAARDSIHWSLSNVGPARPEPLPEGAAVIDSESGAAVGIVTNPSGDGAGPIFSSFANLGIVTNDVGVAPTRDVVKLFRRLDAPDRIRREGPVVSGAQAILSTTLVKPGEMARVKGGPIVLGGKLAAEAWQSYRTNVACMPDFYIDVFPVSVAEYMAWLKGNSGVLPPQSWTMRGSQRLDRRPDLPATGMQPQEALLYAESQDARLVTPVEWQRAAHVSVEGSSEEIIRAEVEKLQLVRDRLQAFSDESRAYEREERERLAAVLQQNRGSAAILARPDQGLYDTFHDLIAVLVGGKDIGIDWSHLPRQIVPLDEYDGDISEFGVRHVTMNAPEMLASRGFSVLVAPKPYPALVDPYLSWVDADWDVSFLAGTTFGANGLATFYPSTHVKALGSVHKFMSQLKPDDGFAWLATFGSVDIRAMDQSLSAITIPFPQRPWSRNPSGTRSDSWHYVIHVSSNIRIEPGFRCAR